MIFGKRVLWMWLGVGDEDWVLFYKGVLLGGMVAMSVMDVVFSVVGMCRSQI